MAEQLSIRGREEAKVLKLGNGMRNTCKIIKTKNFRNINKILFLRRLESKVYCVCVEVVTPKE